MVDGSNGNLQVCDEWPDVFADITDRFLLKHESRFRAKNNIRCMPTYPLTIEDVQAYLERV